MVSYSAGKIPPRGLRSGCAPRSPAVDLLALDSDLRSSAIEVLGVLADKHRAGQLAETLTDRDIAALIHRSVSFVQKGLHTLERYGYCQRLGRGARRRTRLRFLPPEGQGATP